jgi:hypothetical protein
VRARRNCVEFRGVRAFPQVDRLVALFGWFDATWHRSGGDAVSGFGEGEAAVAVIAVAVGDVAGERPSGGVPVEVVGVGEHEFGERGEIARVGRCRNELDPVGGSERADLRGTVGREVVRDPVELSAPR